MKRKQTVRFFEIVYFRCTYISIGRLRLLWGTLGTIVCLFLFAILFQQFRPVHTSVDLNTPNSGSRDSLLNEPIPEPVKEALMRHSVRRSTAETPPLSTPKLEAEDDPVLHIFDEL